MMTTATTRGFRLGTPFGTIRQPTPAECEFVGRDAFYAEPAVIKDYRELGDYVIDLTAYVDDFDRTERIDIVLRAVTELSLGDSCHLLPGVGVYVEE